MKELDLRDTDLREVARQTTNISGCFARKKDHSNIKQPSKSKKSSTRYIGIGKEADSRIMCRS